MNATTTTSSSSQPQYADKPNPQALAELLEHYLLWKAKQQREKRSKRLRGRNRAASIKI